MAKYRCGGGGSPDIVNGIIEEYLAENEDISSNTFVEKVNHEDYETKLKFSTSDGNTYSYAEILSLTDTLFIISYVTYESSTTLNSKRYLMSIDISSGAPTIKSNKLMGTYASTFLSDAGAIAKVTDTTFLWMYQTPNNIGVLSLVSVVDNDFIVLDSFNITTTYASKVFSKLEDNRYFLEYGYQSSRLYACVIQILNSKLIVGTPVCIAADTRCNDGISAISMSPTQVITLFRTTNYEVGGSCFQPITVSGDVITCGLKYSAFDGYNINARMNGSMNYGLSMEALNSNVFIFQFCSNSKQLTTQLLKLPTKVTDSIVVVSTITNNNYSSTATGTSAVKTFDGLLYNYYRDSGAYYLKRDKYHWTDNSLTLLDSIKPFGSNSIDDAPEISIHNSAGKSVLGMIYQTGVDQYFSAAKYLFKVKPSVNSVDGLTKTKTTSTTEGKVAVLAI